MLDPRIYRAALVPVLFALVLLAFSLEDRPRGLSTTIAPDAFDGTRAYAGLEQLAAEHPDRRPGSADDEALGREVADRLRSNGFRVRVREHDGQTIDGERGLRTVIGERAGTSDGRIVIVSHRDASSRPGLAELSGTAGMLELVRLYGAPRQTRRTLTFVSTSGGSGGAAGAAAAAEDLSDEPVEAVLVLGDLASTRLRPPFVVGWSNGLGAAHPRLQRTLEDAVRTETGTGAGLPRAISQMARFAFPVTFGEQGALLAADLPAVLLSATGERAPPPDAEAGPARLEAFGRSALRTITAVDDAPPARPVAPQATTRDLVTERKVLPGWAIRLFAAALLLPVLVTAVDAFARARRRGEALGPWLPWTLACALPFAMAAALGLAMGATGLLAAAPDAPVHPEVLPAQAAALLAAALAFVLGWVAVRPAMLRATGADGDPTAPGAGAVLILVAIATAIVLWVRNPYAALLVAPGLHLWMFAVAPEFRARPALNVVLVVLGALPVLLVAGGLAAALDLGPIDAAWLLLLAVAGGHASLGAIVLACLLAGCGSGALLIAARGRASAGTDGDDGDDGPAVTVRGPRTYAGPGSLGGTESALRR